MRIYVPATAADIAAETIAPRWAHAVTPALRQALPEEDDEGLAESAMLAAADESLLRLRADAPAVARRVVVVAEVPSAAVAVPETRPWRPGDDRLPSAVEVVAPVSWHEVEAIHVDDPHSQDVVRRALLPEAEEAALAEAVEAAYELDLLWYDIVELSRLREELASQQAAPPA